MRQRGIRNPLYNEIERRAIAQSRDGQLKYSVYSDINNQASVRAVLKDMGYVPNCSTRPFSWALSKAARESQKAAKAYGTPNASKARQILETMIKDGEFNPRSLGLDRQYVGRLISEIKACGYEIDIVKDGNKILAYKLQA